MYLHTLPQVFAHVRHQNRVQHLSTKFGLNFAPKSFLQLSWNLCKRGFDAEGVSSLPPPSFPRSQPAAATRPTIATAGNSSSLCSVPRYEHGKFLLKIVRWSMTLDYPTFISHFTSHFFLLLFWSMTKSHVGFFMS